MQQDIGYKTPISSRTKIAIAIIAVVFFIMFVLIYYLVRPKDQKLHLSDTIFTNLHNTFSVSNNSGENSVYFFTGTNIAKLDNTKLSNKNTVSIFKEFPFMKVELSRFNSTTNASLVRIDPGSITYIPGFSNVGENLTTWLYQDINNKPKLLDSKLPIIDADFIGDKIILIGYSEESNQLSIYDPAQKTEKIILQSTNANRLIGIYKNIAYLMDEEGYIQILNTTNKDMERYEKVTSAILDQKTGTLIYKKNSVTYVHKDGNVTKLQLKSSDYYIDDGYIIEVDSPLQPTTVRIYNIEEKAWVFDYSIKDAEIAKEEDIRELRIIDKDPLTLLAVTNSDNGYVISTDSNLIKSLPAFKFPKQQTIEKDDLIYDYDIGSNTAIIISKKSLESLIPAISDQCKCNPNSINKDWRSDTTNGNLTHEDEFTGDGAPPH